MRDFAQELVELVIDNVVAAASTRDIGSCGRVCRRWLPRSRMHLFSSISLSNSKPTTIQSFLDLIDASSECIPSLVRTLEIGFERACVSESHMARLQNFSTLRELRIHAMQSWFSGEEELKFEKLVHTHVPRFGISSPYLTHFELELPGNIPLNVIADLISGLPGLTHLRLSTGCEQFVGIVDPAEITSEHVIVHPKIVPPLETLPPHLHSLDLSLYRGASLFFKWLLSHRKPPIFTSLKLAGCAGAPIEPIVLVALAHISSPSRSLFLVDTHGIPNKRNLCTRAFESRTLAHTPGLLNLTLAQYSETILTTLMSVSSAHLATLKVEVYLFPGLSQPDWSLIDTVLEAPTFRCLQSASFTHYPQKHSLITAEVKALMTQASARNIFSEG
ncbi:hypothetical protein B0H19DRAFT_1065179 [Mycena capillaripes]|nr:hypothetical protein B0H19DRAFT_1065179 [Mycena capillaripes]